MIELVSYSQDVPVSGNVEDAVNYLVFRSGGSSFRVRVGAETIQDLVLAIDASTRNKVAESVAPEDYEEPEDRIVTKPVTGPRYADLGDPNMIEDGDEDGIPSL